MSERWKFQLIYGFSWGGILTVAMTLLKAWQEESLTVFLTWGFLVRLAIFCSLGVFALGYFKWKEKEKKVAKK